MQRPGFFHRFLDGGAFLSFRFVCFLDNARTQWGKKIDEVEIISPAESKTVAEKVDAIVIASQWERDMYQQLKKNSH